MVPWKNHSNLNILWFRFIRFAFAQIVSNFVAQFNKMSKFDRCDEKNLLHQQLSNREKKFVVKKKRVFSSVLFNHNGQVPEFRSKWGATAHHAIAAWTAYGVACTILEKYDRSKSTWVRRRWFFGKLIAIQENITCNVYDMFVPIVMSSNLREFVFVQQNNSIVNLFWVLIFPLYFRWINRWYWNFPLFLVWSSYDAFSSYASVSLWTL